MDGEFMGMMDYVLESFHDLLTGELEAISDSDSSGGSHHPSLECFMADHSKGLIESTHDGITPPNSSDTGIRERSQAPPRMLLEQLREWQKVLVEACLQLEQEHAKLEREIGRRGDGRRARVVARDVNIPPLFARASQNVATAMALLEGILEPATCEGRRTHNKLRTLLERAVQQQAESLFSR
jgi:hypothetical protein